MPDIRVRDTATGETYYTTVEDVRARLELEVLPGQDVAVDVSQGTGSVQGAVQALPAEELIRRVGDESLAAGRGLEQQREDVSEDLYGGLGEGIKQGALGALDSTTFGLSEALRRRTLDPFERREDVAAGDVQGGARLAGGLAADVGLAILSGGSSLAAKGAVKGGAKALARLTPSGATARLGEALARGGAERGLAGRVGAATVGGAVEGGIVGLGRGASELIASDDPVTAERAASVLGSSFLLGAGTGGALGGGLSSLGGAAEKGLGRARRAMDRSPIGSLGDDAADLAGLDRAGLREARKSEVERLGTENVKTKSDLADEIRVHSQAFDDANTWLAVESGPARAALRKARRGLRSHLDEPVGLAENPRKALDALRREAQALRTAREEAPALAAKIAKEEADMVAELGMELATLPDSATSITLTGKAARRYADWANVKVAKKAKIPREQVDEFRRALEAGDIQGQRAQAQAKLDEVIARNEALQKRITGAYEAPKSTRLDAVDAAVDALTGDGGKRGLGQQLLQGAVFSGATGVAAPLGPLAPIIGAKVADAIGNLAGATRKASERMVKALDGAVALTRKAERPAVSAATRVLQSVRYGRETAEERDAPTKGRNDLAKAYRARERELITATAPGPTGQPMISPAARQRVAEQLAPIAATSPALADKLESVAARRVEFLASKLPRRPDVLAMATGPDRWQPSDFEIRKFARYVAAVEDPYRVLERVAEGTVTPEDAEALRAVYPDLFAEAQMGLLERVSELRETLPYAKRLSMSILLGVPVDPTMAPEVIAALQANYASEPGTEGGTVAPTAQPQFGSLSKPEPTAAQERAG